MYSTPCDTVIPDFFNHSNTFYFQAQRIPGTRRCIYPKSLPK